MDVRAAEDRSVWEAFIGNVRPPTFLQSWAWGETQQALGEEVIRLEVLEGDAIVGVAQAVTVTARRGKFLHVPHGPVLDVRLAGSGKQEAFEVLLLRLQEEAKRRALAFLRVSPMQEETEEHRASFRRHGFHDAPLHIHADRLWILDLQKSEEILFADMRKTTRNLIRRGEREGVIVRLASSRDELPTFLRLYEETARRERFVPFSARALEEEFDAFASEKNAVLAVAEYRGQPLAAAMILFTPWSAFYHHGATSRSHPHVPAAVALQWALIQEAKRRGCLAYNFWGVAPPDAPASHPWSGLSLFKRGFGGREVPLVQAQDLPLSPRYWLTYAVDTVRRWKRGV